MKLRTLTKELVDLKRKIKASEANTADLKSKVEDVEALMAQEFLNAGLSSAKFPDLGNPYVMNLELPRIVDQDKFYKYLEDTEQAGMIKRTVNTNTLRSWWTKELDPPVAEDIGLAVFEKTKIGLKGAKI